MEKQTVTIKMICLMEGIFENVKYKGTYADFVNRREERKLIRIYDKGKEIYLNTDYIMSFELGDD